LRCLLYADGCEASSAAEYRFPLFRRRRGPIQGSVRGTRHGQAGGPVGRPFHRTKTPPHRRRRCRRSPAAAFDGTRTRSSFERAAAVLRTGAAGGRSGGDAPREPA
ncbi:unnamed protein product, partial [Ectocarpus sp. 8 AP-2014]